MAKRTLKCKTGCTFEVPCSVCCKRAANRAWAKANPDKHRTYRARYRSDPQLTRIRRHRERGIIDPERQSDLEVSQDGKCAICRRTTDLVLDHDHKTGKVRGLLCQNCNKGLGQFRDSPGLILAAIDYLQEPPRNKVIL